MARWSRGTKLDGLRCHSDAGAQFTSVRYGERLAELGAVPSIGSVGDSFDNALVETVAGYYTAELIRGPTRRQPWKTVEDVELATLGWVHWHNTRRLHSYLGDRSPTEYESTSHRWTTGTPAWSSNRSVSHARCAHLPAGHPGRGRADRRRTERDVRPAPRHGG